MVSEREIEEKKICRIYYMLKTIKWIFITVGVATLVYKVVGYFR